MSKREIIIKDTHRRLWYEDGVMVKVLEAGRYEVPLTRLWFLEPKPRVEGLLVDMSV